MKLLRHSSLILLIFLQSCAVNLVESRIMQLDNLTLEQKLNAINVIEFLNKRYNIIGLDESHCSDSIIYLITSNEYDILMRWYGNDSKGNPINSWSYELIKSDGKGTGWEVLMYPTKE